MADETAVNDRTIPAAPAALAVLEQIDRFSLIRLLGAGGVGEVYLAKDNSTGAMVAFKKLQKQYENSPQVTKDFSREARSMAAMSHPNILPMVYASETPAFYVMPYVDSGTLGDRLGKVGKLAPDEVLDISLQISSALRYIHEDCGTTHRDIKPANILLTHENHAYVSDFGLVRPVHGGTTVVVDPKLRGTQWTVGTLCYMAPEVIMGTAGDARSDLYSLGVMIFEMASGRPPILGSSFEEVLAKAKTGSRPRLRELVPEAPADLEQIIEGLLGVRLRDRYSSAADLMTDLTRLRNHEPIFGPHDAAKPAPLPPPPLEPPKQAAPKAPQIPVAASPAAAQSAPMRRKSGKAGKLVAVGVMGALVVGGWYAKSQGLIHIPAAQQTGTVPGQAVGFVSAPNTAAGPSAVQIPLPTPVSGVSAVQYSPPVSAPAVAPPVAPPGNAAAKNQGAAALAQVRSEGATYSGDPTQPIRGMPPLVYYSDRGDWHDLAEVLLKIEAGSKRFDQAGDDGLTPLHAAAGANDSAGAVLCLQMLIGGENLNPNVTEPINGRTPLHVAAFNRRAQATKALLELGADPNAADNRGDTPLHVAMRDAMQTQDSVEVVELLLKAGADRTRPNRKDETPETLAAGKPAFLKALADVSARPAGGAAPINSGNPVPVPVPGNVTAAQPVSYTPGVLAPAANPVSH